MWKDKRVFISGGAGVIGTYLVEKLYNLGANLYVGDLKPRPNSWPGEIRYRQGDLNYILKEELEEFAPEYFFHLAATFERSEETYDFWEENFHHNVRLSNHLMTCLKDSKTLKKVIFASSYLIYNPELYLFDQPQKQVVRLREIDPIYPRNLCGTAKLLHEIELAFLNHFIKNYDMVCARIFRSYGKNSRDVISRWVRALLRNEKITVYNEEGMFDYIYAGDVAEGLIKLAESKATGIYNLGRDHARSIAEVIEVLKRYFPEMKIEKIAMKQKYEASQANMDLFRAHIGWSPKTDIEQAIPEIIDYERKHSLSEDSAEEKNILITSISKKVPLIKSVKKASIKLGQGSKVIGADINNNCIGKNFVDQFWHCPCWAKMDIENFLAYCEDNHVRYIIPTRDGELRYFAEHREYLKDRKISVMVSSMETIQTCLDKLEFYRKLTSLGYPVILTTDNIEEITAEKFVVKERFGAGANNIGLNLTKQEAREHAATLQTPIYQPYIQGKEVSADLYLELKGRTKGVILRYRELIEHGESQVTATFRDEKLERLCAEIAEKLNIYGHAVFQLFITDNGEYQIIEVNPRFGGASTLSLAVGLDSFYWFLLESDGNDLEEYSFIRPAKEKRLVRHVSDLIY